MWIRPRPDGLCELTVGRMQMMPHPAASKLRKRLTAAWRRLKRWRCRQVSGARGGVGIVGLRANAGAAIVGAGGGGGCGSRGGVGWCRRPWLQRGRADLQNCANHQRIALPQRALRDKRGWRRRVALANPWLVLRLQTLICRRASSPTLKARVEWIAIVTSPRRSGCRTSSTARSTGRRRRWRPWRAALPARLRVLLRTPR